MADPSADPADVVRDAFAWINGDASKIDAIAEDVDVYGPALPEGEVPSREEWDSFIEANREGFPDIEFAIQELVVGDEVVMVELTISGTHTGSSCGFHQRIGRSKSRPWTSSPTRTDKSWNGGRTSIHRNFPSSSD